ncbi:MAG TPA: hypothetical protein VN726_21125 [Hanamia sp.]|nr:hypothetical protein [Hanamia sp.]
MPTTKKDQGQGHDSTKKGTDMGNMDDKSKKSTGGAKTHSQNQKQGATNGNRQGNK